MEESEVSFIQLEELKVEYFQTGDTNTEVLLFIHGLGANLNQFKKQHSYFSGQFRVISPSLRGHGNSVLTGISQAHTFTLKKMGADIIELLEKLQIGKAHFVGNSMGGNVGYEIMNARPSLLLSLTTFGTTPKLNKNRFTVLLITFFVNTFNSNIIGYLSSQSGMTPYARNLIKTMIESTPKSTILKSIKNISNFDYLNVIDKGKVPILTIIGGNDKAINKGLKSTLQKFKGRNNFYLNTIRNAGHFLNFDNPKKFNYTLHNFLVQVRNYLLMLVQI
ncbi:alpha/beta fold hydrolase [Maribacter sp. 2210JD10-5]|uniref:alpha/beta fold hydrolase n=1 Tax=Maribacter sp. 2210JD10-5 TaxID=3386272 RepID=UPI0039BD6002